MNGDLEREEWVNKRRDNGEEEEDRCELFVHLGLVDLINGDPLNRVGISDPAFGALVSCWNNRQAGISVRSRGSLFVDHLACAIAHELGHCIAIAHRELEESAFRIKLEQAPTGKLKKLFGGPLPPSKVLTEAGDNPPVEQECDLRLHPNDTMIELVEAINADANFVAQLHPEASPTQHPISLMRKIPSEGITITGTFTDVNNTRDDFIMDVPKAWDHVNILKFDPTRVVDQVDLPNRWLP